MASLPLRLRGTFIEYDESEELAHELPKRRSRALTLPSPKAEEEGGGVFDGATSYVSDLSEKLRCFWSNATTTSATSNRSLFESNRSFFEDASVCPSSSADGHETSGSGKDQPTQSASELLSCAKSEDQTPSANDLDIGTSPSQATAEQANQQQVLETLNGGSLGHPDICARPCLYYASGNCAHGSACTFCHLPHLKRPVHLDKKHREMLQKTPGKKLAALLAPLLKEKLLAFDTTAESSMAFERFMSACGLNDGMAPARMKSQVLRGDRSLIVSCRAMPFRLLLLTLLRGGLKDNEKAQQAGEALLSHLIRRAELASGPAAVLALGGGPAVAP